MATKRIKLEDIKNQTGKTDESVLEKMTDAEIIEHALQDLDMPVPTKDELKEFIKAGRKDKPRKE